MNNYTQLLIIHAENKKSLMSLLNPCARDRQISIYQLQLIPVWCRYQITFFYWSIQILCMKFTTNLTICWSVYFNTALVLFTTEIKIVLPYNILMYYDVWYNIYNLQVYPTVSPHHFGTVICITVCMIIYTCICNTITIPPRNWCLDVPQGVHYPVPCNLSAVKSEYYHIGTNESNLVHCLCVKYDERSLPVHKNQDIKYSPPAFIS